MKEHPHLSLFDRRAVGNREVIPIQPGVLRIYTCGPTVYSYAHIGNFRSFLTADLLVRVAKAVGYSPKFVCNITDVGHLTEDSLVDARGEDKLTRAWVISGSQRYYSIWDMARAYTDCFLADWKALNLVEPDTRPRASEHVAEQLDLIEELMRRGYAYETERGVYFDLEKWPSYGALSGNVAEHLTTSGRELLEDPQKRDPRDFALWKKDPTHLMRWHSPYGWGFPGWHIECSAMAIKYLGEEIDIHTGGEDNRFPHHECEIAQSEAFSGRPFVRHWLHTAHLRVDGRKMAKSAGNFLTVRELLASGIDPLALRHALLGAVYRDTLNFTKESLATSSRIRKRIQTSFDLVARRAGKLPLAPEEMPEELVQLYDNCLDQLASDLNMPGALRYVYEGVRYINNISDSMPVTVAQGCLAWFDKINELTGLIHSGVPAVQEAGPAPDVQWIMRKISERDAARMEKKFEQADSIRNELSRAGVEVVDSLSGSRWRIIDERNEAKIDP